MTNRNEASVASTGFVVAGEIFMDVVFAGLDSPVRAGQESFAKNLELAPGGIANSAFTLARLGQRTSVVSTLGQDAFGEWMKGLFEKEGIDLSLASRIPESSVTASMTDSADRAMVTFSPEQEALDFSGIPAENPVIIDLGSAAAKGDWWQKAHEAGTAVYADVRWEGTEDWKMRTLEQLKTCSVFTPNEKEAFFLTGTESVEQAASKLAELVDVVVVTAEKLGAFTVEQHTGKSFWSPSIKVNSVDPTGAGDVFLASLAVGRELHLSLEDAVAFATLVAGISVTKFSGSLGAPQISEILEWHKTSNEELSARYEFVPKFVNQLASSNFSTEGGSNGN